MHEIVVERLRDSTSLRMGETIIAAQCSGEGLPIYSADTGTAPWNYSQHCRITHPRGTIVIGARGSIGNPRLPPFENFACTQTTIAIKPDGSKWDSKFLFYVLSALRFDELTAQQAVPMLTVSELGRIEVPRPPRRVQTRIAEILWTVDEAIEQTGALIAKTQQIKAGLMQDLFTRGVTADGQLRPPRTEAPQLYKKSSLGWIPKDWKASELRTWLGYVSYGFTNPMPETEEGPYMVTAADVVSGEIQYQTCRRTSQYAYDNLLTQKSRPRLGDVLLTKDGTLGRIAVVDRENVCINQSVAVLRPSNPADSHYLAALLSAPKWQQKMMLDAGGSTIRHIYITVVDKMIVGWPPLDEREAIVERVHSCLNKLAIDEEQKEKLVYLKRSLMQGLLTGRIPIAVETKPDAREIAANV